MTVLQMRLLLSNKPDCMSWAEFNDLEIGVFNDFGLEYISEFKEGQGVIDVMCDCHNCEGSHTIFGLITEDLYEELHSPEDMDTLTAQEELSLIGKVDMDNNLN